MPRRRALACSASADSPAGEIAPSTGGVGVQGVAGGVADGLAGTTDAHFKSGVFGFNSLALNAPNVTGFGVFGRCDTAGGAARGESAFGNGARAHSAENDGVVGLSDALNKSGVYGFNSSGSGRRLWRLRSLRRQRWRRRRRGFDARSRSSRAQPVQQRRGRLQRRRNEERGARRQFLRFRPGLRRVRSSELRARRRRGRRERARLRRELPGRSRAAPHRAVRQRRLADDGAHQVGEFFVDSTGDLFFCKVGGVGPAAKWVKLA